MTSLYLGILIGIVVTVLALKYVLPFLDIKLEKFSYKESIDCTQYQLASQALAKEFEQKYGEIQELQPAIGFHHESDIEELIDEDEEDDCEDCCGKCNCKSKKNENQKEIKNQIGFNIKS